MDEERPPTAAELGLSDAEFSRILEDLHRRHPDRFWSGHDAAPGAVPSSSTTTATTPPGRPWRLYAVLAAVVLACAMVQLMLGGSDDEPAYAFIDESNGRPVTFSSCAQIGVAVYPAGGPPNAEQLVRDAVDQMRAASGLDLVVVGSYGGHAANWNFEAAPITLGDPVSVSWQDGDAIASLTDDVAGIGGSPVVESAYGGAMRVAGTIALSKDYYRELDERGDHDQGIAVVMHELGHVLGLAHVDSRNEIMAEDGGRRTTLGPGDRQGLRLLGQGPCV